MKEETRKRLAQLILDELADKIRASESLGQKFEAFTDLPVEKVANAILNQFDYLLSSELRNLIIHLIEQEVKAEQEMLSRSLQHASETAQPLSTDLPSDEFREEVGSVDSRIVQPETEEREQRPAESIMEYFSPKEPFPSEEMDIELQPTDWYYLYGFGYAPDSAGKGYPTVKLSLKGIDKVNNIFLLDYGDVRFYMSKVSVEEMTKDKSGIPVLIPRQRMMFRFEHESILNALRKQEVLVPLSFWTIVRGRDVFIKKIEDRYVELLRVLIDVHDAIDWNLDVYVLDEHMSGLSSATGMQRKGREAAREPKHPMGKKTDVKLMEKVVFKEKTLAQEIHSKLMGIAQRSKIDYMIRLESAFADDWKPILSARYVVGKEKRKVFCTTIMELQNSYQVYLLMFQLSNPTARFLFIER